MISPICERAMEDAVETGRAILTHIHPLDIEATVGEEVGFHLPKPAHKLYTDIQPVRGNTLRHAVTVEWWQLGITTDSDVTWSGSEYRLIGFAKGFPFLKPDCIGDLLVIVPHNYDKFTAYVLNREEDIEEIHAILGLDIMQSWSAYHKGMVVTGSGLDERPHPQT